MKMACKICEKINKEELKIYEDDKVVALLSDTSTVAGHLHVAPKEHYTIFEQIPPETIGKLFNVANRLSMVLVQNLQMGGVNLVMNNGVGAGQKVPHFFVDLIPRNENDGLNFAWQGKQLDEAKLTELQGKIKAVLESKDSSETTEDPVDDDSEDSDFAEEEDYLLKSIDRIP